MIRITGMVMLTLLFAGSGTAGAQMGEDDSPVTLPSLKRNNIIVAPVEFPKALPQGQVAVIDGEILTQADLLRQLLKTNLNTIAKVLLDTKLVELELSRAGIEIPEPELMEEINEMMPRLAPGKTMEEVIASGIYSKAYLMRIATMNRGWKRLFWAARNIPEDQRANQANQFLIQMYMGEVKNRYQLAIRGQNPSPPRGALAGLNTIIKGKRVSYVVSPEEAMEFLIGLLRPASIIRGLDQLIDAHLVDRAMRKSEIRVSDSEIEGWVREMRSKYEGPFNWDMILKVKGTTPDQERQRWHDVQAWKRATNADITPTKLAAFREEHIDFFRSRHVKVRHVLIKCIDDVTGLSLGNAAEEAAQEKAERITQLAREGVDFQRLAQLYSDDTASKKNGGQMPQPIKKWGGPYEVAFQKAAYALEKGEVSTPVKTSYGYHVIYCDEVSPPTNRDIDWDDPRYADWILEEYESIMAGEWKKDMRAKAKITQAEASELLKIKQTSFPKKTQN